MAIRFDEITEILDISEIKQNGDYYHQLLDLMKDGEISFADSRVYNDLAYYNMKIYNTNIWGRSDYRGVALTLLNEGLRINSSDYKLLSQLGAYYCLEGDYEKALDFLEKSLAVSQSFSALHNYGVALYNLKRFEEASESFLKAHLNCPNEDYNFVSYIYYAITLAHLDQVELACKVAEELIALDNDESDDIYELDVATIYYACKEYRAVYDSFSNFEYNYHLSGNSLTFYLYSLFKMSMFDEMETCINNAIESELEFKKNNVEDDFCTEEEKTEIASYYDAIIENHKHIYNMILTGKEPEINFVEKLQHTDFLYNHNV